MPFGTKCEYLWQYVICYTTYVWEGVINVFDVFDVHKIVRVWSTENEFFLYWRVLLCFVLYISDNIQDDTHNI